MDAPAEDTVRAGADRADMLRRPGESDRAYLERLQAYLQSLDSVDDRERVRRIAVETMQAFRALASVGKAVSVFGSSRAAPVPRWGPQVRAATRALVGEGFAVITGGGPGIMAEANRGAADAAGASIGLTIDVPSEESPNPWVSHEVHFHYFFLRKFAFVKYASAFVCFPGGFGTLDELFEALNLVKTLRLSPFPVVLYGSDYWDGLLGWMHETCVAEGCLNEEDLALMTVVDDVEELVAVVLRGSDGLV